MESISQSEHFTIITEEHIFSWEVNKLLLYIYIVISLIETLNRRQS